MPARRRIADAADLAWRVVQHNLKIVFAGKFVYFLGGAVLFFLGVTAINIFAEESVPTAGTVYELLLFPGMLIVFYPTAFGIQHDVDTRMIEILFGIPDYRYKVWLVRLVLIYAIVFVLLVPLSLFAELALAPIDTASMVWELMFPIFFLGGVAFMVSTIVRSGNGTAVIVIVVGVVVLIFTENFGTSRWNIFLNPFHLPDGMNEAVWADVVLKNRIFLSVGSAVAYLAGLFNLQKREKFVQ